MHNACVIPVQSLLVALVKPVGLSALLTQRWLNYTQFVKFFTVFTRFTRVVYSQIFWSTPSVFGCFSTVSTGLITTPTTFINKYLIITERPVV